jgi:SAM-dependent methyltransferase
MDHLKRITDEFTRQAQTFATWAEKVDADVGARFGGALGDAARGRVIDIACGPGVVTAALAPNAASVVAFDATDEMLTKARARCATAGVTNVEFKSGDAEHLPFADAQFDGAVTRAAVHHFAEPQNAFNEMFRVLRPGGVAVIADCISSENGDESRLHNAIERLRDPSTSACCRHRCWRPPRVRPGLATWKRPRGTWTASLKNGWRSSAILSAQTRCGSSCERWPRLAVALALACPSKMKRSFSSIAGSC